MSEPDARPSTGHGRHPADALPLAGSATVVVPPPPGRAVLACRCGRVLALADMHRPVREWPRSPACVDAICCRHCAVASTL